MYARKKTNVLPEILRSKVGVFADLFRKTQVLRRHSQRLASQIVARTSELERANQALTAENAERRQAEERLQVRERELTDFVDNAPLGLHWVGPDGIILWANQAELDLLGYAREEYVGRHIAEFHADQPTISDILCRLMAQETLHNYEARLRCKDGAIKHVLISSNVLWEGDRFVHTRCFTRDVTERKQAEEALRENEEKFRQVFAAATDAIFVVDAETSQFIEANDAALRLYGYSRDEFMQMKITDIVIGPEPAEVFVNKILAGEVVASVRRQHRKKDGTAVLLEASAGVFLWKNRRMLLGTVRDVTERERIEAKLQQAQKLDSLGTLAGGIAHDFNNLLMAVLGHASLALMKLPPAAPVRFHVEQMEVAGKRAAELTHQMLAYSGRGRFVVQALNLSQLVKEMAPLLEAGISKKAVLRYNLAAELPTVEADVMQLQQLVVGLITNAAEALDDQAGMITVTTGVTVVDGAFLAASHFADDLPAGTYAYVEVSDTGIGMDAATRVKIFDPFFSTKFTGRGLGLAAVLGIVRGHQGAIRVDSEPGHGTVIRVALPCAEWPAQAPSEPGGEPGEVPRGSETILVVDDEPGARDVARMMLEEFGYAVLTAGDGQEGVDVFRAHADAIGVVLLDMMMPKMNGNEAFAEIRRLRPDARVILSSGYSEQDVTDRVVGQGLAGFLQKPYQPRTLLAKVRAVLDEAARLDPSAEARA